MQTNSRAQQNQCTIFQAKIFNTLQLKNDELIECTRGKTSNTTSYFSQCNGKRILTAFQECADLQEQVCNLRSRMSNESKTCFVNKRKARNKTTEKALSTLRENMDRAEALLKPEKYLRAIVNKNTDGTYSNTTFSPNSDAYDELYNSIIKYAKTGIDTEFRDPFMKKLSKKALDEIKRYHLESLRLLDATSRELASYSNTFDKIIKDYEAKETSSKDILGETTQEKDFQGCLQQCFVSKGPSIRSTTVGGEEAFRERVNRHCSNNCQCKLYGTSNIYPASCKYVNQ